MSLLAELHRRNVIRVGIVYVVASLAVIETADLIFPTFDAPQWINQAIIVLAIIGLPIALGLAWAFDITPDGVQSAGEKTAGYSSPPHVVPLSNWALVVLMLLVIAIVIVDRFFWRPLIPPTVLPMPGSPSYNINLGNLQRQPQGNILTSLDFSPDGSSLYYSSYMEGTYELKARDLTSLGPRTVLESDLNFNFPKVSPDNRRVLLRSDAGFYLIFLEDSNEPRLIAQDASFNSFDWLSDERIVYAPQQEQTLHTLSLTGGEAQPLPISSNDGEVHRTPFLLPGGESLLYTVVEPRNTNVDVSQAGQRIEVIDLGTGEQKTLLENAYAPTFLDEGYLLFMRGDDLWAVRLDIEELEVEGREVQLISGIESYSGEAFAAYAVSSQGQLVYVEGQDLSNYLGASSTLVWVDSELQEEALELPPANYFDPSLSPDGSLLAVTVYLPNGRRDIWVYPLGGVPRQLTFSGDASNAIWTPEGRQLAYIDATLGPGIWVISSDGIGQPERLMSATTTVAPDAFTSDGRQLVFMQGDHPIWDLNLLNLDDPERSPVQLLNSEYQERQGAISPDDNWLAYMSDRSGIYEVYVSPFPEVNDMVVGTSRVSQGGGTEPTWSADGNRLYYIDQAQSRLVAVDVDVSDGLSWGPPVEVVPIFDVREDGPSYVLDEENQRVLLMRPVSGPALRPSSQPVLAVAIESLSSLLQSTLTQESQ